MTPCDTQPLRFTLLRLLGRERRSPEPPPSPAPPPAPEVIGAAWPPADLGSPVFAQD